MVCAWIYCERINFLYVTNYNILFLCVICVIWCRSQISYEYDGNLDISNINEIFSHLNEDNSIIKIGIKIINLILCTLSYCTLYYTLMLMCSDKINNICKSPYLPPMVQRTPVFKTPWAGPELVFSVLCKYNNVCDILFLI